MGIELSHWLFNILVEETKSEKKKELCLKIKRNKRRVIIYNKKKKKRLLFNQTIKLPCPRSFS